MYISKDSTVRFKDDSEDHSRFATKTLYFRYYSGGLTLVVSSFGPPRALSIKYVVDRSGDTLTYHSDYISDDIVDTISDIKNEIYDMVVEALSEAHPSDWSGYFFGDITVSTLGGKVKLNSYIMDLNDIRLMPREEIASHLEELMGPDLPRVPVNPMAWILEDRPVEVVSTTDEIDHPPAESNRRSAMIEFTPSSNSTAKYHSGGVVESSSAPMYIVNSGPMILSHTGTYDSLLDAKKVVDEFYEEKASVDKHTLTTDKFKQYWIEDGWSAWAMEVYVYKAAGLPPAYNGDDLNAV